DSETDPRYSHLFQRFYFVLLQRTRLALECYLLGFVPGDVLVETISEISQLRSAQVRRSAAAEVDVLKGPAANNRHPAIELDFLDEGVKIGVDVTSILVRVDSEIAELAPFPTEGNMKIQAQGCTRLGRRTQHRESLGQMGRFPEREGWIVGNEVV